MEQVKKDVKKMVFLNNIVEDLKTEIIDSLGLEDFVIIPHRGGLYTELKGFLCFVKVYDPNLINCIKFSENHYNLEFYADSLNISTVFDDLDYQDFQLEFIKLQHDGLINSIIVTEDKTKCKN